MIGTMNLIRLTDWLLVLSCPLAPWPKMLMPALPSLLSVVVTATSNSTNWSPGLAPTKQPFASTSLCIGLMVAVGLVQLICDSSTPRMIAVRVALMNSSSCMVAIPLTRLGARCRVRFNVGAANGRGHDRLDDE